MEVSWSRLFEINQEDNEPIEQFYKRVTTIAKELPGQPSDFVDWFVFHKLRNGLRPATRAVLNREFNQPNTLINLREVVHDIEKALKAGKVSMTANPSQNVAENLHHTTHLRTDSELRETLTDVVPKQPRYASHHGKYNQPQAHQSVTSTPRKRSWSVTSTVGAYQLSPVPAAHAGQKRKVNPHQEPATPRKKAPRHVPEWERMRRKEEDCCYECGASGHYSKSCPLLRSNTPY